LQETSLGSGSTQLRDSGDCERCAPSQSSRLAAGWEHTLPITGHHGQFSLSLRERGVPEENLTRMAEDKIDKDIVKFLGEEELSVYIPRYGDRVFAKNWKDLSSSEMGDREERKKS
ncbi:uncharacterized protein si:ch73-30l9.1 isoform X1, partial [Scomber scombrus]